jgi:ABC-2 type transport system permease protein
MKLWRAWAVTANDFSVFRHKKYVFYSLIALPVVLSIGLPITVWLLIQRAAITALELEALLNAFSFFFIILPSLLPTVLASYSFVGEKLDRSLEPLLATPVTDGELLLGKSLAAFIPSLLATYLGAAIFVALVDQVTYGRIGSYYFPNWDFAVILLVAVPLACTFSVEVNVIISSLVSDIRAAQMLGIVVLIPVGGLYVLAETDFRSLDAASVLIISAVLLGLDVLLFFLNRVTFRREEILTKWK